MNIVRSTTVLPLIFEVYLFFCFKKLLSWQFERKKQLNCDFLASLFPRVFFFLCIIWSHAFPASNQFISYQYSVNRQLYIEKKSIYS